MEQQRVSLVSFSVTGGRLAKKIADFLQDEGMISDVRTISKYAEILEQKPVLPDLKSWCQNCWKTEDLIVFVGASGIAVRTIAPCVNSKVSDPAVLVIDEMGNFVISLLSGHLGGANFWASMISEKIGAAAVITTATDVHRLFAVDVWAKANELLIDDMKAAKEVSASVLRGERILLYCPEGVIEGKLPRELCCIDEEEFAAKIRDGADDMCITVSPRRMPEDTGSLRVLHLIPRVVTIGIGCRRDQTSEIIHEKLMDAMDLYRLDRRSLEKICSIDLKKNEPGILALASGWELPFETYTSEQLRQVPGEFTPSSFVAGITGVDNVCERSAVFGSENGELIMRKQAGGGVTVAAAMRQWRIQF